MRTHRNHQRRTGSVMVLAAVMMVVMFGVLAFAVDLGYVGVVHTQLQASADATALASAWELVGQRANATNVNPVTNISLSADTWPIARQYASLNRVANEPSALGTDDVVIGRVDDPSSLSAPPNSDEPNSDEPSPWNFDNPSRFNAVKVRVQKTTDQNGSISLFFAKMLGVNSTEAKAEATAMFRDDFIGFGPPANGTNLQMLPYAMDEQTWKAAYPTDEHGTPLPGTGTDEWKWDGNDPENPVKPGHDGILEVNLFPQGTDVPGNRGTVDIGNNNNSTKAIATQIKDGISSTDLANVDGGELKLDANGELELNGDTGISAGVKDDLASLIGWKKDDFGNDIIPRQEQTRIIPIFSEVTGPGNNATYTIVGFECVRIMEVKLTGSMSGKRVILQKAHMTVLGGVPAPPGSEPISHGIYSPVWLVR